MSEQNHIIKRQVIELEIQGAAEAGQLQAEVSRIYRRRIVPLIDRCCTELSQPDRLHRIELLEIDLGPLDPRHLEAQLVAKLEPALRRALAEQIGQQEQVADRHGPSLKATAQLELLAFFARTGSLPWWADAAQAQLLDDCLAYLLHGAPEPLRHLMRDLVREQRPLRRLVYHYADALLSRLCAALAPSLQRSLARDPQELIAVLQKTRAAATHRPAQLRQSAWTNILQTAAMGDQQYSAPEPLYQEALIRIAAELRVSYNSLIADIHQVVWAGQVAISLELKHTLETLYRERPRAETSGAEAIGQRLAQLRAAGGALAGLWAALQALAPQLPAPLQGQLLAALGESEGDAPTSDMIRQVLGLVRRGLADRRLALAVSRDVLAELRELAAAGLAFDELSELTQMLGRTADQAHTPHTKATAIDLSFSDADELYIGNAGLVILWPFLGHFFARLGLLEERQFKDQAARQRAVGLLQYIATGDPPFPEFLLPLNKVLCGMELAEVFDFDQPVSESEAEECTDLLRAVIAQAPILRDMSAAGFRGTFLLRRGMLRARDGAWLLQVERETYDIVLDRFPWGWEWVKLPWMEAPLWVEWS